MKHINNFDSFNESSFFRNLKKERKDDKMLSNADNQLKLHLKKYLLKKFSFQYDVVIWKSPSTNYEEIDVYDFEFIDLMIQPRYDWDSGRVTDFFLYLYFVDKDGDKFAMYITDKTPVERMGNLEYMKPWDKNDNAIQGNYTDSDKDDIDLNNEKHYPRKNGWLDLVPNEYKTTEFLKEVKSTLEMINDSIK